MGTVTIDFPQEMVEIAQKAKEENKPSDICHICPFLNESCGGPDLLTMDHCRWVEWANQRAKDLHLTREKIAEKSILSIGTVSSALAGRTNDIRMETMRAITQVLLGDGKRLPPCHFAALLMAGQFQEEEDNKETADLRKRLEEAERASIQRQDLMDSNQRAIAFLKEQISFKDEQIQKKDKSIRRKEIIIVTLFIVIAAILFTIIAVLIYDKMNPHVGWFRDTAQTLGFVPAFVGGTSFFS